jgi:hypothetical protein
VGSDPLARGANRAASSKLAQDNGRQSIREGFWTRQDAAQPRAGLEKVYPAAGGPIRGKGAMGRDFRLLLRA